MPQPPRRVVVLAGVALLWALAGCGSEEAAGPADPSGAASTTDDADGLGGVMAALSSDVKNTATAMEVYFVDHATYVTSIEDLGVETVNPVVIVAADDTAYELCAVDPTTGAWAGLSSVDGAVYSGESGGSCKA